MVYAKKCRVSICAVLPKRMAITRNCQRGVNGNLAVVRRTLSRYILINFQLKNSSHHPSRC